jgi:septal ring factor EnvC (AmiA/AmiB activator)
MATTVELTCPTCGSKLEAVNKYYMQCHNCRSVYKRDFSESGVQLDFVDNNLDQMMTQMNRTVSGSNMLASEVAIQRLREDVGALQKALGAHVSAAQAEQRDIEAINRQIMTLRERREALQRPVVEVSTRPDRFGPTLWLTWGFFAVLLALRANGVIDGSAKSPFMSFLIGLGIAPSPGAAYRLVTTLDVLALIMLVLVPLVILLYYGYRALQFREVVRDAGTDVQYERTRLDSQIEQMQSASRQKRDELSGRHEEIAQLEGELRKKHDDLRWHEQRVAR